MSDERIFEIRKLMEANITFNNLVCNELEANVMENRAVALAEILSCVIWTMVERGTILDFHEVVNQMIEINPKKPTSYGMRFDDLSSECLKSIERSGPKIGKP